MKDLLTSVATAIRMFAHMLLVDAMLDGSHYLENGLGFLEVDAKVELLEACKDLTKLIHSFVKVCTCGKSPRCS